VQIPQRGVSSWADSKAGGTSSSETDDGTFFLSNYPRTPIDDTEVRVGCDQTNRLTVNEAEGCYGTMYWRFDPEAIHRAHHT